MQILSGEYFLSHDKLSLARADPLSSHFCSSVHANITCECLRGCVFQVIHVVGSCLVLSLSRLCLLLASVTDRSTTIKMRIGILLVSKNAHIPLDIVYIFCLFSSGKEISPPWDY